MSLISKDAKVAFVTGVNGITGFAIVEHLIRRPKSEWSKIIISSRTPLTTYWADPRVEFVAVDFLAPPEQTIKQLTHICTDVTHAYFTSYVHNPDLAKLPEKNVPLFKNFIDAVVAVCPRLQRVSLQTGGKYYGALFVRRKMPLAEDTPRYDDKGTNFYFPQEDYLAEAQKRSGGQWSYNVFRPNAIVGFTPRANGMSLGLSMAVYLLIHAELGQKAPFPGNEFTYRNADDVSYPPAIADLTVWATTQEHAKNETFNSVLNDIFFWTTLYEDLANYFGTEVSDMDEMEFQLNPGEWAKDKKQVWQTIVEKYGGNPDAFDWCTWDMWTWLMFKDKKGWSSMAKAKKFGWARQDFTLEIWIDTFRSFENAGVLPKAELVRAGASRDR